MPTLIFDIETVGEKWEEMDAVTQQTLTRWIERTARDETERVSRTKDVKDSLGFSPLTGFIVSIAVYDLERQQGAVYYRGDASAEGEFSIGGFVYKERDEATMLKDFWDGARSYDTFVTFNGRCFDVPFLLHRSVSQKVVPSVDLMRRRYVSQQAPPYHIDLQDELTFYGAMPRRPGLHLFCRAYGIKSPKTDDISGDSVATLYQQGKYRQIAEYNASDVVATAELYRAWKTFLYKPKIPV